LIAFKSACLFSSVGFFLYSAIAFFVISESGGCSLSQVAFYETEAVLCAANIETGDVLAIIHMDKSIVIFFFIFLFLSFVIYFIHNYILAKILLQFECETAAILWQVFTKNIANDMIIKTTKK